MSLINQMLHDLEQRRMAKLDSSPLGGLSASGLATQPVGSSINYITLAILVTMVFASGVLVAYLLDSQQQIVATKNTLPTTLKKETSDFSVHIAPKDIKKITPDFIRATKIKTVETVAKNPIAEKITSTVITPNVKNITEVTPVIDNRKNINKIIRPFTNEQQAQLSFQRAVHMLSLNHQQDAQRALEEALSFSATHLRAREMLAAVLLNTGRMNEAENNLKEGLHLMPDASPLAKLYARILVDQGNIVTAITVLERARPAVTIDLEYHALLAALYQQMEKYAQAVQVYQQILLQRPGAASWWMGLALAQEAMGKTVHALDAFQRAQRVGGLNDAVLKYIQTRIVALTPVSPVFANIHYELDELED